MRIPLRTATALLALTLIVSLTQAQTTLPQTTLLALSKHDHTLSVIDPTTLRTLYTLPVGPDPHEVIASTDGTRAYVSNYGGGHTTPSPSSTSSTTHALPSIDLGPLGGPHGLAFANGKLYFTSEVAKAIGRYDPSTQKIDWILGTGQNRIHMVDVSPDAQQIIATNPNAATVTLANIETIPMGPPPGIHPPANLPPPPPTARKDWNETQIPVGHGAEGFDLSPDRKEIWVANAQDGTISIIDYPARRVIATLHPDVHGANRLKFTPDGRHVLVSLLGNPDLVILDAASRKVIKRLPIGTGAAGILMDPTRNRAFVANTPDNRITLIDLNTLTITAHIPNIPEPDGMAWAKSSEQ